MLIFFPFSSIDNLTTTLQKLQTKKKMAASTQIECPMSIKLHLQTHIVIITQQLSDNYG